MTNFTEHKNYLRDEGFKVFLGEDHIKLTKSKKTKKFKFFNFPNISSKTLNTFLFESEDCFALIHNTVDYETMKLLKKLNVNFLDLSGNMLIQFDDIYISIYHKSVKVKQAFKGPSPLKSAGIKFAYSLLREGVSFLDLPVKDCSKIAGISYGAVSNLKKMFENYYLDESYELNKMALINDFSISFNNLIKPKATIGKFFTNDLDSFIEDQRVVVSGQHSVKHHMKKVSSIPRFAHVYIKKPDAGKVVLQHKLQTDLNKSNILIWNLPFNINSKFTPLFLAYSDLIDSDDPRDKELALEVFNELLS